MGVAPLFQGIQYIHTSWGKEAFIPGGEGASLPGEDGDTHTLLATRLRSPGTQNTGTRAVRHAQIIHKYTHMTLVTKNNNQ